MPSVSAIQTWLVQTPAGILTLGVASIVLYEVLKQMIKGIARLLSWAWPKFGNPARNKLFSALARPAMRGIVMCMECKESKQPEKIVIYTLCLCTGIIVKVIVGLFAFGVILANWGKSAAGSFGISFCFGVCFVVIADLYKDAFTLTGIAKATYEIQLRDTLIKASTTEGLGAAIGDFMKKNPGVFVLRPKRQPKATNSEQEKSS